MAADDISEHARERTRPMRADARRNRERLLEVARECFATEGVSVPVDEIARRAGLGAGTMHRHFPTKESLFEAIVLDRIAQLVDEARALAEAEDPGEAFFGFCRGMVERGTESRGLAEILAGAGVDAKARIAAETGRLDRALERLVERARESGQVRADIGVNDVRALLNSIHTAVEHEHGDRQMALRMMTVICDGLRADRP
ncbi:TetR/AcrR family transcriptional regulator [Actinoallomurus acaciae]|uniref:TetR/AcrR family transcriptional regulator n=1 Tax=Actinoallomurus acaciae TaxID=502577 RepID=A0ABV5YG46_9ACTN